LDEDLEAGRAEPAGDFDEPVKGAFLRGELLVYKRMKE
jgi:hypothetical protein